MITAAQVKSIAGSAARPDLVAAIVRGWPDAVAKAKLTTARRAAFFLANIMTETGGLRILSESGAYSASRIMTIFGVGNHSASITAGEAKRIAALPVAQRGPVLFNRVYGTGNPKKMKEFKNTGVNDGWLYRGGGMMQCTGKSNYAAMEKKTGLPLVEHPELLHQPDSAFRAAYLEWAQDGRCNDAADRNNLTAARKAINGGTNGLSECKLFAAKALQVLADYEAHAPVSIASESEVEDDPVPTTDQPQVVVGDVIGDPQLFHAQRRLKALHYSPGKIDGVWGGGSRGALSSFMLDRGMTDRVPASLEEFHEASDEIDAELDEAEGEGWSRPVTAERRAGDNKTVAEIAPEVVPVRRNFLATLWLSISTFAAAIWNTVSEYVSSAWDFFTDHKDVVDDNPGIVSTVWGYVASVPPAVWLFLAAAGIAFVTYNSWRGVQEIKRSVSSGERQ